MEQPNDSNLLELDKLTMQFGGITAVKELSFCVPKGKIFSLIGPNGAGKTTAFNATTGIYEPTAGEIRFLNHDQKKPVSWQVILTCALVAICTGIAGMIMLGNVSTIWEITVKNLHDRDAYSFRSSFKEFVNYHTSFGLSVRPSESSLFAFRVTYPSDDGAIDLVNFGDAKAFRAYENEMRTSKRKLKQLDRSERSELERKIAESQLKFNQSTRSDVQEVLGKVKDIVESPSRNTIEQFKTKVPSKISARLEVFQSLKFDARLRHWKQAIGLVGGLILGALGYVTVWNRSRRTPDVIGLSGMARTFQNIRLFRNMTVIENVLIGLDRMIKGNIVAMAFRLPAQVNREKVAYKKAQETLRFVGLENRANRTAGSLPYGEQRRLEIARALATEPKLLLLDEPGAGMNPSETAELMELIRKIRGTGVTVLLIEHHMNVVMGISDHIVVMDQGQKIAEGTPEEVRNNPKVIEAYLGKEELG